MLWTHSCHADATGMDELWEYHTCMANG